MGLGTRIAALILAAVFAAAPALVIAAMDSGSCCCPPAPCHETEGGCEMTLSAAPCCGEAPATAPSTARRIVEPPTVHPMLPARLVPAMAECSARLPVRGGDLEVLVSPLRRSVVLLV